MDLKDIKIGVLGGGVSSERDISLSSSRQVMKALENKNIEAIFIDINTSCPAEVKEMITSCSLDVAFIALHGEFGEDGQIQAILQDLSIPYTGSGPLASSICMDKISSKEIFLKEGIPTPPFFVWSEGEDLPKDIKYPVVVKPRFSGSSLGISIVRESASLKGAVKKALSFSVTASHKDERVKLIFEDYIEAKELTVGILDDEPLAPVEIIPKHGYFDFNAKYTDGMTDFKAPAGLKDALYEKVRKVGIWAHRALGCRHFSRVDIRLGRDGIPYVLEVNSIPGLTSHSLLPLSAHVSGIEFEELILNMLALALSEETKYGKQQKV